MGLLDRVAAERDRRRKRAWPLGPGSLMGMDSTWGHDQSQFAPEEYGDYIATSSQVYAAANLRARLMSGLDLRLYRGRDAKKTEITAGPVHDLLDHVNPFWTPRRLRRMDELSMCLWGETYWVIERENGTPVRIWWVKPTRMKPVLDEIGYIKRYLYEPAAGGQQIEFGSDEVIWFRYPNPIDEFSPLSPLAAARLSADTGSAMMQSNWKMFTNGLQMAGIVVPDTDKVKFTSDQAEDLERSLERRLKGVDKAHKWAVLRYEAQFRPMNITPKDAEFVAGLNLTLRDVCNAYGIPSPLLNDLEHATLSNAREFERMLWTNGLQPDAQFRAEEIEEQLLPLFKPVQGRHPNHCEFDFTKVAALQESATEAWARERQAIEVGALTINEVRESKGLPPVPWGDAWWAPVNKSAVDSAESRPEGDTAPTELPDPKPAPAAVDERAWQQLKAALTPINGSRRTT